MGLLAVYEIPIIAASFSLVAVVLIIECQTSRTQPVRSHAGRKTNRLMMATIISNAAIYLLIGFLRFVCLECKFMNILIINCIFICRTINFIFMVHRAKIVQGMTPLLSDNWFDKKLPIFYVGIGTFCASIMTIFFAVSDITYTCLPYSDTSLLHMCYASSINTSEIIGQMCMVLYMLVMVISTFFLISLFVVPLIRIYRTDLGRLNDNQLRSRKKMKILLKWSVSMSCVNLLTSLIVMLPWKGYVLHEVARWDFSFNVLTSWLMVTRNRQTMSRLFRCQCTCCAESIRQFTILSALTNIPSKGIEMRSTSIISQESAIKNTMKSSANIEVT